MASKKYYQVKIGETFNDLTVIELLGSYIRKGKRAGAKYLCRCICGNESHYRASTLNRGISKRCHSCACKAKTKIHIKKGDRFGDLVVIRNTFDVNPKTGRKFYYCKCKCGQERRCEASRLNTGKIQRCPTCSYKKRPQSTLRYSSIDRLYRMLLRRHKKKKFTEIMTVDDFKKIVSSSCTYCGSPPPQKVWLSGINKICTKTNICANGIDRINPDLGYTKENSTACCHKCNMAKLNFTETEFRNHIIKIYKYYVSKKV